MCAGPSPTSGPRGYLPSASKRPWPRTWPSAYARTRPRRACGTRRAGRRAGAIAALLKGPERSRSRLTRRLASWPGPAVSPARPRQTPEVSMASFSPPARSPAASLLERGRGTAVRRQPFHRSCGAGMGGIAAPRPAPRRRPRALYILHPTEVGAVLSLCGADDEVVAAGLLHDVIEDTDAEIADVRRRFGGRVAHIVAAVNEDPDIGGYDTRMSAPEGPGGRSRSRRAGRLRHRQARQDPRAPRPGRTRGGNARRARPDRRLEHYEASLSMLQEVAPGMAIVDQLAFELWALRTRPPAHVATAPHVS